MSRDKSRPAFAHVLATMGILLIVLGAGACGGPPRARPTQATADPLGPRPIPSSPLPFYPPDPKVFDGPGKSRLWVLERHTLPMVRVSIVVPYGSACEPPDKDGLSVATAKMMREGAGDRDAVAFSEALRQLGAQLWSEAGRDASMLSLEVLATKLDGSLPLLADALIRPRYDAKDWARVWRQWKNELIERPSDPNDVAELVTPASFYGRAHPYGRAHRGTLSSVDHVQRADVAMWHKTIWRPDAATVVVVGDVNADAIRDAIAGALASWTPPPTPRWPVAVPKVPQSSGLRTFVVDRAGAPHVIVWFARSAPSAADPDFARVSMLPGTLASRLNGTLREAHGWTYDFASYLTWRRGPGMLVARGSVRADALSPALGEARKVIETLRHEPYTEKDMEQLCAWHNTEAIKTRATLDDVSVSLEGNARLGLPPDQDGRDLASQWSAQPDELAALHTKYFDMSSFTIVLVGPKDVAIRALEDNQLPKPTLLDTEGRPIEG
jgi:zinc protease